MSIKKKIFDLIFRKRQLIEMMKFKAAQSQVIIDILSIRARCERLKDESQNYKFFNKKAAVMMVKPKHSCCIMDDRNFFTLN